MNNSITEREASTMYYTQEQIDRANQADLVSFLQGQGGQLTRAGNEYRWKRHDSLTIRGNKWYRHSQSKGGAPIDFVMEFYGKSFTEAVELLTGEKGATPPPDRPAPPVMIKKIGKTTYRVKIYFSETSKETMIDKIKRLILNDSEKIS